MNKKNKNLKQVYNNIYKKGEEKHFTSFKVKKKHTSEADEVLSEINWKSKKVLEVGCGTGNFAFRAAKKGANIFAIDYSNEAIEIAKKKYRLKNLEYQCTDVKQIKEYYDVIVSIGTLEHMDNPLKMLRFFKSHLKNNGKIIITSPNWVNPRGYILMTLLYLFEAPITLADLHYLTPINFQIFSKKLRMSLSWRTTEQSWALGDVLLKDFQNRLPKVFKDLKLSISERKIKSLIIWLEKFALPLEIEKTYSGAIGIYVFKKKKGQ